MRPPATGRALWLVFLGTFVGTAGLVLWTVADSQESGAIAWVQAGALVTLAATGWGCLRQMARARATAAAELAQALARIHGLTDSQGRFAGNIAHEIKTPLAIVLGQADLLLACGDDPADVRRYARSISEETRHLSDLVESFLRLARPFAQEDTSYHVPVFFHDCVVDAVRRSESLARDHAVHIVVTLPESGDADGSVEVLGDPVLLEAMIENVVRNALRFSPRGARVEVIARVERESIVLQVRDHGPGIAEENLTAVFDWFFDVPSQARRSTGTGFGLAIARRVAEHHHGTIALRNNPEGGCEFEIRLPRWRPTVTDPAAGAAVPPAFPVVRPA